MRQPRGAGALRRPLLVVLLVLLFYLVAGELLQAWVRLYLDAWRGYHSFGTLQHEREWQRAMAVADFADDLWPWKVSLHRDVATLHLFGVRGYLETEPLAAAQILVAADRADRWSSENAATQLLRARAYVLLGDAEALRLVAARLHALAPNEAGYQEPLLLMSAHRAQLMPALQPVARELAQRYAARDPEHFAQLLKRSVTLRQLAGDLLPP